MPAESSSSPPSQALIRPLRRLLRPLVRMLIRRGVTFPMLADLLRALYVDVAANDLLSEPKARTDSRISVLTGVHRKEIRRLRISESLPEVAPPRLTLSSEIIARWLGTPDYTDGVGQPRPLPRATAEAGAPSFEKLVEAVTKDVRARAVLDDWLGQGIVTLDGTGRVLLNLAAFIPRQGSEEQLFYFARNLHDHIAAAAANVLASDKAPFLDRSLHYDRLGAAAAAELETLARDSAQRMLLALNQTALALAEADDRLPRAPDEPCRRVNLGVYLYVEDEPTGGAS